MRLDGIHHITAITGDAVANVEFYVGVLGLRLVKKTVNQDDPTVYHLFYADEDGSPGSDLTFFEYPGAVRGRAGAGMVHRVVWRVATAEALDFWAQRLGDVGGVDSAREGDALVFADPEGLEHELVARSDLAEAPLVASGAGVPAEHALQGFDAVRAFRPAELGATLFEDVLGFTAVDERPGTWEVRGPSRGGLFISDPPVERGRPGAGTVHHVAYAMEMDDADAWQQRVAASAEAQPTPIIDRFWFRSVYFREPGGVLFELATKGPGFDVDEDAGELGEKLVLPPRFESQRPRIEPILTPLPDAAAMWRAGRSAN